MAIVLICSKYIDRTFKIAPEDLLEKAGHGSFNLSQLLEMETRVLQVLGFRIGRQEHTLAVVC